MNFTDRQSYLECVAAWKAHYKHVSQEVRQLKAEVKAEQRKIGTVKASYGTVYYVPTSRFHSASSELYKKRVEIGNLLLERAAGKVKAGQQRAENVYKKEESMI